MAETAPEQCCPECGADWSGGVNCESQFHQMLFWEAEFPVYGVVHHLTVLCYHLQHPSLYSPEALNWGIRRLGDFVEGGLKPQEVRRQESARVASGRRDWKVKGTPQSHGSYPRPVVWTLRAGDVVRGGAENYVASVQAWAEAMLADLRAAGIAAPSDSST